MTLNTNPSLTHNAAFWAAKGNWKCSCGAMNHKHPEWCWRCGKPFSVEEVSS